ncbi:cytokine receptor-like factor 2 [Dugong dugon]
MRRFFPSWAAAALLLLGDLVAPEESEPVKPKSPEDLNFLWQQEAVTVTCSNLSYKGLLYEVQYRSDFDSKWESTEQKTCSVTVQNLDADKCYYFRTRVKTMESRYGSETYPSDWSEVTHWQGGERKGNDRGKRVWWRSSTILHKFMLRFLEDINAEMPNGHLNVQLKKNNALGVKNFLIPSVPDPKFTFPGLFEDHRGNFQEWIKFTENMAYVNKVENEEEECALEEMPVAQLVKAEAEAPTTGLLCPQTEVEEALGPGQHPHQSPQHSEVVTLGGFSFVMSDNSYVML